MRALATAAAPRTYRRSALASALIRMWRGWTVVMPVVIANAAVQGLLVWPGVASDRGWLLVLAAALSAIAFVVAFGLVGSTALRVPDGRVTWSAAAAGLRSRWRLFGVWALVLLIVLVGALAINAAVGLLVLALTPFLLLAALDGRSRALGVNLQTIGRRFWRWVVTCVITGAVIVIGTGVVGVTQFFLRGSFGAFVVWLVAGLVTSWFTVAWALIYRSAWAPAVEEPAAPTPDLEPTA